MDTKVRFSLFFAARIANKFKKTRKSHKNQLIERIIIYISSGAKSFTADKRTITRRTICCNIIRVLGRANDETTKLVALKMVKTSSIKKQSPTMR